MTRAEKIELLLYRITAYWRKSGGQADPELRRLIEDAHGFLNT